MNLTLPPACLLTLAALLASCSRPAAPAMDPAEPAAPATNRIDVPAAVRQNLGIEFVTVERRRVASTLRLPGHFELLPAARTEHRTPIAGRVRIAVQPLQPILPGDPLYTIESPDWRRLQRELGDLRTELAINDARLSTMQPLLAAHQAHEERLLEAAQAMTDRVQSLEAMRDSVGGQAQELANARVQLAQGRAMVTEAAEQHTEVESRLVELRANLAAGQERFRLALAAAATLASSTPERLLSPVATVSPVTPMWQYLSEIEVRATTAGIAAELPIATGAWLETGGLAAVVVDLSKIRFRAKAPQSDLPRLATGLPARVVHDGGTAATSIAGTLQIGAEADPVQRTIDLFLLVTTPPVWARPGVAAFLEIETATGAASELAIPLSAVMPDGTQRVFFRRDPAAPDKVIRVEADLGINDGRWVEVKSGLADGDEVVLAGAYELMLASSGSAQKGGHFHADGTFHADDHK
ncbi:MAG: HlyD family efflux transporter periplasmic adaptor subunit [Planctomycetes bacterium]|nr:HlyD family efflux transporter periplasmic adaptor subunit [Planctomycetota bacterium]